LNEYARGDVVVLRRGAQSLTVRPAEGARITRYDWNLDDAPVAWLYPVEDEPPAPGHAVRGGCYPLAPYVNRIANARFDDGGGEVVLRPHPMVAPHSLHGIAWTGPWEVETRTAHTVALRLEHAHGDADWPWPLRMRQTIDLQPHGLTVTLELVNIATRAQPVGLGFHPFFPEPDGLVVGFEADALWHLTPDRLPRERGGVPPEMRFNPARRLPGHPLDEVYSGWDREASLAWPARGRALRLRASAPLDHLVVFSPPGRRFCCLEPVSQVTNAFNLASWPAATTGYRRLEPGASLCGSMQWLPRLTCR